MAALQPLRALSALSLAFQTLNASAPAELPVEKNLTPPTPPHRSIHETSPNGVHLRAEAFLLRGDFQPITLAGPDLTGQTIRSLLGSGFITIINGSFFRSGRTMGDLVAVSFKDPSQSINRPFLSHDKSLNKKINSRYFIATTHEGECVIGRRSNLLDPKGNSIPQGKDLSPYFTTFLGGLAYIGIDKPAIQKSLVKGDHQSKQFFIDAFNVWNGNYSGQSAHNGLDPRARPRSAAILAHDSKSNLPVIIILNVGTGTKCLSGMNIFQLSRNALFLCKKLSCTPDGMVLLDGGGSTCFGSPEGVVPSAASPLSALGIRSTQIANSDLHSKSINVARK